MNKDPEYGKSVLPVVFKSWCTDCTYHTCLLCEIMLEPLPKCPPSLINLHEVCALTAAHSHDLVVSQISL